MKLQGCDGKRERERDFIANKMICAKSLQW